MKTYNASNDLQYVFVGWSGTELPAEDRDNWDGFTSGQLADTNKRNTVDLVSHNTINYISFMICRVTLKKILIRYIFL